MAYQGHWQAVRKAVVPQEQGPDERGRELLATALARHRVEWSAECVGAKHPLKKKSEHLAALLFPSLRFL